MTYWRRLLVAGIGALGLLGATTVSVGADEGDGTLIEFESMTPVQGAAVGTVNDRGIKGGGLPWVITSGTGVVSRDGDVEVTVKGLIIPSPPLPVAKNPVPFFKATVSCITPGGIVNVSTSNFPATMAGDSTIKDHITLPRHCRKPIVFVAAPTGQWFAMSNREDEGDD